MELMQGKIKINRKEMQKIRKMDHAQLEQCLTEVMWMGYTASEEGTDRDIRQEVKNNNRGWQQAVQAAVTTMKGIGEKRKELFMEYLKIELEKAGICTK